MKIDLSNSEWKLMNRRVKRLLHRLQSIVCPADGIPLPLQHDGDSPYDLTVIIDHENTFVHSEFLP